MWILKATENNHVSQRLNCQSNCRSIGHQNRILFDVSKGMVSYIMAAHTKCGQTVLAKNKNNCKQWADGHIDVLIGCVKVQL